MVKARGNQLYSPEGLPIGKVQLYAFLVDEEGNPIVDDNGNEMAAELQSIEGMLMVKDRDTGTGATGVTIPAGGAGLLGWLSGIYNRLAGIGSTGLTAGSALVGKVGIDQTSGQNGIIDARDLRDLNANKPVASMAYLGYTFWSMDTDPSGDEIESCDGTQWTVMA